MRLVMLVFSSDFLRNLECGFTDYINGTNQSYEQKKNITTKFISKHLWKLQSKVKSSA